jgi:hypothetical protein
MIIVEGAQLFHLNFHKTSEETRIKAAVIAAYLLEYYARAHIGEIWVVG